MNFACSGHCPSLVDPQGDLEDLEHEHVGVIVESDQVTIREGGSPKKAIQQTKIFDFPALTPGHFGLDACMDARGVAPDDELPKPVLEQMNALDAPPSSPSAPIATSILGGSHVRSSIQLDKPVGTATPTVIVEDNLQGSGKRMDGNQMLEKVWWGLWCCCFGCGKHKSSAPLGIQTNCMCFNWTCQTTETVDPEGSLCGCVQECLCCVGFCRGPPKNGNPRCVCCGCDHCGLVGSMPRDREAKKAGHQVSRRLAAIDVNLAVPWWPCWCCCTGVRFRWPHSCWNTYAKCACCEYFYSVGCPSLESGFCFYLLNCWNFYSMCKCPPTARNNPIIACCGRRAGGDDRGFVPQQLRM